MKKIEELKKKRYIFLNRLYEIAEGDELKELNRYEIGEELGFDRELTDKIAQYLKEEGLIKFHSFGGIIRITHSGIRKAEEILSSFNTSINHSSRKQKNKDSSSDKLNSRYRYDIALSYASENIKYVEVVYEYLKNKNIRVFYDKDRDITAELWGKDLVEYLDNIFSKTARYCLMFISKYYEEKAWPTIERRTAIERQISNKQEYILPARFDDTAIPGIRTIGYIDLKKYTPVEFGELVIRKILSSGSDKVVGEITAPAESFIENISFLNLNNIFIPNYMPELNHMINNPLTLRINNENSAQINVTKIILKSDFKLFINPVIEIEKEKFKLSDNYFHLLFNRNPINISGQSYYDFTLNFLTSSKIKYSEKCKIDYEIHINESSDKVIGITEIIYEVKKT